MTENVPKALRQAYKGIRAENRMLKERIASLEAQSAEGEPPSHSEPGDEVDGREDFEPEPVSSRKRELTPEQRQQLQEVTSIQAGRSGLRTSGPNLSELDNAKSLDEAMEILRKQGMLVNG